MRRKSYRHANSEDRVGRVDARSIADGPFQDHYTNNESLNISENTQKKIFNLNEQTVEALIRGLFISHRRRFLEVVRDVLVSEAN